MQRSVKEALTEINKLIDNYGAACANDFIENRVYGVYAKTNRDEDVQTAIVYEELIKKWFYDESEKKWQILNSDLKSLREEIYNHNNEYFKQEFYALIYVFENILLYKELVELYQSYSDSFNNDQVTTDEIESFNRTLNTFLEEKKRQKEINIVFPEDAVSNDISSKNKSSFITACKQKQKDVEEQLKFSNIGLLIKNEALEKIRKISESNNSRQQDKKLSNEMQNIQQNLRPIPPTITDVIIVADNINSNIVKEGKQEVVQEPTKPKATLNNDNTLTIELATNNDFKAISQRKIRVKNDGTVITLPAEVKILSPQNNKTILTISNLDKNNIGDVTDVYADIFSIDFSQNQPLENALIAHQITQFLNTSDKKNIKLKDSNSIKILTAGTKEKPAESVLGIINNYPPKRQLEILNLAFEKIIARKEKDAFKKSMSIFFNHDISDDKKIDIRAIKMAYWKIVRDSFLEAKMKKTLSVEDKIELMISPRFCRHTYATFLH